ncbi:MAG: hypothetical protein JJU36_01255 [Phycisphaeraceae bacterium]|nr:hypothetical protein [Phycisphaeraceae bacterium]
MFTMMHTRTLMTVLCSAVVLLGHVIGPASIRASAAEPPVRPAVDQIDPELLQKAIAEAVANGIGSLVARQQAPGNDTDLIFPPRSQRSRIGTEVVGERRYREITVNVPRYEREYAERLVPQRDEYGSITGYRTVRVEIARRQVGISQQTRRVRDPEGDIVRRITRPIWDPEGIIMYPRGFFGLNGMALYVLSKAGLQDEDYTRHHARELAALLNDYGLPDHTWDLAWLVAGYSRFGDSTHDELITRMVGKLVDGQIRDRGPALGMWGPVSIHYPLFTLLLDMDYRVIGQLRQLESQLERLPEDAHRERARLRDEQRQVERLKREIDVAMADVATHAVRLERATRAMQIEERRFTGLSYYIFNRALADVEATSIAAFALEEAQINGKLPRQTRRTPVNRRPTAAPESVDRAIANGVAALIRTQLRNGGWDEHNLLTLNQTFQQARSELFRPLQGPLPRLLNDETLESTLKGAAAIAALMRAAPQTAARHQRPFERGDERAVAAIDRLLDEPLHRRDWPSTLAGRTTPLNQIAPTRGVPQFPQPARRQPDTAIEDLPYGLGPYPYRMLEGVASFFRPLPGEDSQKTRHEGLYRQLAYRLLVTQSENGQWTAPRSMGMGMTTSEVALLLHERAVSLAQRRAQGRTDAEDFDHFREHNNEMNSASRRGDHDLYGTLVALCVLLEGLGGEAVELDEVPILPVEDALGEDDDDDAEPMTPHQAARSVARPNNALGELLKTIR